MTSRLLPTPTGTDYKSRGPNSKQVGIDNFFKIDHSYSPEVSPVSLSVAPGSAEARKMTVISGRKCLELFRKQSPIGLLAKTLLASSAWDSTAVFLTWKEKVTKSKRLLFQLAPSKPRTEGTGCGLLPTAHSNCSTGPGRQGRDGGVNLQTQIAMLPTPRAGKTTNETEEAWMRRKESGNVATPPLALAINMLPTPSALMGQNYEDTPGTARHTPSMQTIIAMLPTPATRDYKGANGADHMSKDRPHMDQLPNAITHGTNPGLKLQPAFVEWMMGYPDKWTELID